MTRINASTQTVIDQLVRLLNTESNSTARQDQLTLVLEQLSEHVPCWCGLPLLIQGTCNNCDNDE